MNDNTAFVIYMGILATLVISFAWLKNYGENNVKIEAIKAGLIQKIDHETKEPIWTKP